MPIEKLEEFARNGQKNTDELILTDGFPRPKFPARQWFNYLFNMLSLKINELIDLDPVSRSEIVDDLKTNDSGKALSASMGKKLQDEKFAIADLVNDLTTGGIAKALTAEQGKLLFNMFAGGTNYFKIPNPLDQNKPWIVQFGGWLSPSAAGNGANVTFPIAFPNEVLSIVTTIGIKSSSSNSAWIDSVSSGTTTTSGFTGRASAASVGCRYIAIGN